MHHIEIPVTLQGIQIHNLLIVTNVFYRCAATSPSSLSEKVGSLKHHA